jgi:hypothetical protein
MVALVPTLLVVKNGRVVADKSGRMEVTADGAECIAVIEAGTRIWRPCHGSVIIPSCPPGYLSE